MNALSIANLSHIRSRSYYIILGLILIFSVITKAWNISKPDTHYFDEIYYGFTAEQYAQGNIKAWVWDYSPPEGFAYTWDHPPTGKLIMSAFIKVFGISSTTRRLAPLIAGSLLPLVVFYLSTTLFPKKPLIGLMAAFLAACDGLLLSLSRIALTDTILTLFICLTALFLWKKQYLLSAIFFGLSVSTKWTGVYLIPVIGVSLLMDQIWTKKQWFSSVVRTATISLFFAVTACFIYLLSYTPLFVHYGFTKFVDLHKQMWWYHTNLKATHPAQSAAYLWPIDYRPVWFWVDYQKDTTANIYAMLNPIIAWGGIVAVLVTAYFAIQRRSKKLALLLLAYAIFWVPWIFSPRIMFLYHYLPSVPFMIICIAYALHKLISRQHNVSTFAVMMYLSIVLAIFTFFYPYWTGIAVLNEAVEKFRWLKTWGP